MYQRIFNLVKSIVPRISETELIALRSGNTSIDRQLFKGYVNTSNFKYPMNETRVFPTEKIDNLLKKYNNDVVYPSNKSFEIIDYLGKNNFFSFIIDKEYGGFKSSVNEFSSVLTKITTANPSLGVCVMVPNSLGPGELITHYGTDEQKETYLSGLANGKYVPCFGLTGPNNGSDATGSIDEGTLKMVDGQKVIELEINKRYITLAPVANLVGLAFRLNDPDNLLESGRPGVTVALLDKYFPGLQMDTHHNPLNAGFPNGTLKGKLQIPLHNIIGGEENAGEGWKMLMECLAAGRGICLPGSALASSKVATFGVWNYALHRKQFKLPLVEMEGVRQKLLDMFFDTWCIESSVKLTNTILDAGNKPAVISAIMKQQSTDRARDVLNNGMDIHAGGSICLGESNFMEKFYRSAPVGITVEGSNTLTRNLIIFGQGINKSHPHISDILESILEDDVSKFKKEFNKMISHCLKSYFKSLPLFMYDKKLIDKHFAVSITLIQSQTGKFAHLANIVALKGGGLKREQYCSSDMADIMSNLFLAHSIIWYHRNRNISEVLSKYCLERLHNENQKIINRVVDNLPLSQRLLVFHLKSKPNTNLYKNNNLVINEIKNNSKIIDVISEDVYFGNTILNDLKEINNLDVNSEEYNELYNKIINVGEFKNIEN